MRELHTKCNGNTGERKHFLAGTLLDDLMEKVVSKMQNFSRWSNKELRSENGNTTVIIKKNNEQIVWIVWINQL
jgi:hypothetical protein